MGRATIRLKYVLQYKDKTGKLRTYFRKGSTRIPLPGEPSSQEFSAAYLAALGGIVRPVTKGGPGGVKEAVEGYLASPAFKSLAVGTRKIRKKPLDTFMEKYGSAPISELKPAHIAKILTSKANRPPTARNLLKTLRGFLKWCVETNKIRVDPSAGLKVKTAKTSGFHTWTEEEIEQFIACHPLGTKPHLALSLLLYTCQRRQDVVIMGKQHIRNDILFVRQKKTGMELYIPTHPALKEAIEASPTGDLTFIVGQAGKGFSDAGFSNWFRKQCNAAKLPNGVSAHGLRKASCRRLAEAGCTEKEIAAISGHVSLAEVQRYTKAADQKRMAYNAMSKVTNPPEILVKAAK